jgi:hypothetical protein
VTFEEELQERISELLRHSREADRIDRDRADEFGRMVRSAAWKLFVELLDLRIQSCADVVTQPSGGVEGAWKLEYIKGAMYGLLLARDLPANIIANMKASLPPEEDEDDQAEG